MDVLNERYILATRKRASYFVVSIFTEYGWPMFFSPFYYCSCLIVSLPSVVAHALVYLHVWKGLGTKRSFSRTAFVVFRILSFTCSLTRALSQSLAHPQQLFSASTPGLAPRVCTLVFTAYVIFLSHVAVSCDVCLLEHLDVWGELASLHESWQE